ncbi:MAG: hypothetical protein K2G60_03655 [Oscillospiraceae bacterium]|nr:hypothetical protein [Oscillospiraceae bacterium]
MKKHSAIFVSIVIMVMALLFTSCGIKNSKKDANTPSDKNSAHLDSGL